MSERGVVPLMTAVIYRYYRQGVNSVEIAEEFRLKSPQVRMWLYRMHTIANRMWHPDKRTKQWSHYIPHPRAPKQLKESRPQQGKRVWDKPFLWRALVDVPNRMRGKDKT